MTGKRHEQISGYERVQYFASGVPVGNWLVGHPEIEHWFTKYQDRRVDDHITMFLVRSLVFPVVERIKAAGRARLHRRHW